MQHLFFTILTLSIFKAAYTQKTPCTSQWECTNLAVDYNYIECVNNQCVCRLDQGFQGDATSSSLCQCNSPNVVRWWDNEALCILPTSILPPDPAAAAPTPTPPTSPTPPIPIPVPAPVSITYGSCVEQWQCSNLSDDFNYINCVNQRCVCRTSQGFSGSATSASPCTCLAPNTIQWVNGAAYCIDTNAPITITSKATTASLTVKREASEELQNTACEAQWQCAELSEDYNYVACVNNTCQCRLNEGFSGLATPTDLCHCNQTKSVIYINGSALCDDVPARAPVLSTQTSFQACNGTADCLGFTTLYGAVNCSANRCVCQNNLGFTGNGSKTDPCGCAPPKQVFWQDNIPYCVSFPQLSD